MQKIVNGGWHSCTKRSKLQNLERILPDGTLDELVARHLKSKLEEADGSHIMLKTGGKPMTLKRVQQQQQMSVSGMITMKNDASLSRNGLLKVAKNVRQGLGRHAIEPGLPEALTATAATFKDCFAAQTVLLDGQTCPVIYCTDVNGFLTQVFELRGL